MSCNGCRTPPRSIPAELKDPRGLLDRQQPLHHHARLQHRTGSAEAASRKTYQDLLDPKWRGKIAWNGFPTSSGVGGFVGTVLAEMGEDKGMAYLRELAKQNVANLRGSAREVLDQVIAGEYPIALQIFNHHAVISAKKGAPVDWIKMEPATGTLSVHLDPQERAAPERRQAAGRLHHLTRKASRCSAMPITSPAHPDVPALRADA